MAQICKLELQTEIKSSPDRLFDIYKNKTYLMPKISPDQFRSIEVLEGDGKSVGSVRLWTYVMGSQVTAKDKIDAVDDENKSITFNIIGGEITKYFKSFKATLEAGTSVLNTNLIKWSLEYEKANEDVPTPNSHLDFLVNGSRVVDAYLLKS
ncbi:MLP-like protein 423 [Cornus florida]|uniref:MLP-like protein 423 n=1 Tax=Cornus florida TaxID=4283 RepID=UPI00289D39F7|nr:MLP-like protein 423 [Cornus florida]